MITQLCISLRITRNFSDQVCMTQRHWCWTVKAETLPQAQTLCLMSVGDLKGVPLSCFSTSFGVGVRTPLSSCFYCNLLPLLHNFHPTDFYLSWWLHPPMSLSNNHLPKSNCLKILLTKELMKKPFISRKIPLCLVLLVYCFQLTNETCCVFSLTLPSFLPLSFSPLVLISLTGAWWPVRSQSTLVTLFYIFHQHWKVFFTSSGPQVSLYHTFQDPFYPLVLSPK